jgi:uncharacterized protein (TIGR01777 family)
MANDTFTMRSPMPVSAEELYAWHSRPLAFQRLQPPWEKIDIVSTSGAFGRDLFRIEVRTNLLGPVRGSLIADAYDFQPGRQFQDVQVKGPFAHWHHTHRFIPSGSDSSFLEDFIEYRLPLGPLGRLFGSGLTKRRLAAMFAYRHAITRSDLQRHARFRDRPRLTIAITGSRGMVGSVLVPFLTTGGHRIVRLVTGKGEPKFDDGTKWVHWDPTSRPEASIFEGIDAVIHLAGDNVASGRWTDAKKRKIRDSRTIPTRHLAEAIAALPADRRLKAFVGASAIGFYGNRGDETLTEDSQPGTGYFPEVCREWEEATGPIREAGIRTVNARTGVVLSPKDGALGKQLFAFEAGAGAVLGSGRQWISWIDIGDHIGALHECLMNEALSGPVNCAAPHPATNREFAKTLGRALHRPAFFWLPPPLLRAMFGELADEGMLSSTKVLPKKLLDAGFAFDHSELLKALQFVLGSA